MDPKKDKKTEEAKVQKENQDFPNVPAATDEVHTAETLKKEIKKTSKLNPEGKTDNTEHHSEN